MQALDAIRRMVEASGKTSADVCREMGTAENYIRVTLSRKSVPKVDTFAEIAHACGFRVKIVGQGESHDIDGEI